MKQERRCSDCNRTISLTRKLNLCSYCYRRSYWKDKYENLKNEFEQHNKLCSAIQLDLWKRLKKHEPELTWDEEPE